MSHQNARPHTDTALTTPRESADAIVARVSLGHMGDQFDHVLEGRARGGEFGLIEFAKWLAALSIKKNADQHFRSGPYAGLSRISKVVAEPDPSWLMKHAQVVCEACWDAAKLNATQMPEDEEVHGPYFMAALQGLHAALEKSKESDGR